MDSGKFGVRSRLKDSITHLAVFSGRSCYYDANQLLLDCLNSNCEVTAAIRQKIEATLLLPQKELEDREWQ
ncbi:NACHT C-terminal helical domain 2-containing protein [Chlorogloeopsis sp. ULAP02]|uniref:NACHT C-terminal helical domain 2-containing protein n=1 Tax=Chlorogloeopsis sp. ULAP02 TaxID=3107926 RepID=UPI00398B2A41